MHPSASQIVDTFRSKYGYDGSRQLNKVEQSTGPVEASVPGATTALWHDGADGPVKSAYEGVSTPRYQFWFEGWQREVKTSAGVTTSEVREQYFPWLEGVRSGTGTPSVQVLLTMLDGHVAARVLGSGAIDSYGVLGAYGAELPAYTSTGPTPPEEGGFHGMERDRATGLTRMGVRHVSAGDGRWLQPEPLLMLGGLAEQLTNPRSMWGVYGVALPSAMRDRTGLVAIDSSGGWWLEPNDTLWTAASDLGVPWSELQDVNPDIDWGDHNREVGRAQMFNVPERTRLKMLEYAAGQMGRPGWAKHDARGLISAGKYKCNLLPVEAAAAAGKDIRKYVGPRRNPDLHSANALAEDDIEGLSKVTLYPLPGHIAAKKGEGHGHVGLYLGKIGVRNNSGDVEHLSGFAVIGVASSRDQVMQHVMVEPTTILEVD